MRTVMIAAGRKQFIIILLLCLANVMSVCQARVCAADMTFPGVGATDTTGMPDFHKCFRLLEENRRIYNLYNDSIFLVKGHDEWIRFFRRRALKNQQIFTSNSVIIGEVLGYFKNSGERKPSPQAYNLLLEGLRKLMAENRMDPFLGNEITDILLDYYHGGTCPDSLNYAGLVDYCKGSFLWEIYTLGKDSAFMRKSYDCFKRSIREDRFRSPCYVNSCLLSLKNLTVTNWLTLKVQSIGEYRALVKEMESLLTLLHATDIVSGENYKTFENSRKLTDERLIRNVYFVDSTIMEKHYADSLMSVLVDRNLHAPNLSDLSYSRTLLMQMKLGQITTREALQKMDAVYKRHKRRIYSGERFDNRQLTQVLMPFVNYFYINDKADVPFAKKRARVKRLVHDIVKAYHQRMDQQANNSYVKYLNLLATYPRIIKYLTEKERIFYLNELNVATQVTTYAHSSHVAMIAEQVMIGVLKYRPELLVGVLGDVNASQVRQHSKRYIEYIRDAAMYHDIGKNAMISVVNNDYRPLTDNEYAIIKTHPALGVELLKIAPSLRKFRDTTLGHHKWYNGKGGYPEDFDNTKSPLRIMIDIVKLSDCMQAATERLGRNYKGEKTFDAVMAEFREDAGTIYNPDLVALIDAHPDLAENLAELINDGWVEIYYDIYSQFIR